MNPFSSIRRVALGAALASAALGAVPALASAQTTCTFDPAARLATVVNDGSGADPLVISRNGPLITASPNQLCIGPHFEFADVNNTDRIVVNAAMSNSSDGVDVDETHGEFGPGATPESDGNSEIEIVVNSSTAIPEVRVFGTDGDDVMRAGGTGRIDIGRDEDTDITAIQARRLTLAGGRGDDFLSGRSVGALIPSRVRVTEFGGPGNDILVDAPGTSDELLGNSGDDTLFAIDGIADLLVGGAGNDNATLDTLDLPHTEEVETRTIGTVGRLQLAPRTLRAHAGKTTHLSMSWTHPKSWHELRGVMLRLYRGTKPVGMINLRPGDGRLTADGAVKVMSGSRVTHAGKTVKARLALRLAGSLAGEKLRVAVQATDRHGHKQLEPDAGVIRVAK